MASWAALLALSGFNYSAVERRLMLTPRIQQTNFRSFWSAPSGWGNFAQTVSAQQQKVKVETVEGTLAVERLVLDAVGKAAANSATARLGSETLTATLRNEAGQRIVDLGREVKIAPGQELQVTVSG